jgi:hypothetical protein
MTAIIDVLGFNELSEEMAPAVQVTVIPRIWAFEKYSTCASFGRVGSRRGPGFE